MLRRNDSVLLIFLIERLLDSLLEEFEVNSTLHTQITFRLQFTTTREVCIWISGIGPRGWGWRRSYAR